MERASLGERETAIKEILRGQQMGSGTLLASHKSEDPNMYGTNLAAVSSHSIKRSFHIIVQFQPLRLSRLCA